MIFVLVTSCMHIFFSFFNLFWRSGEKQKSTRIFHFLTDVGFRGWKGFFLFLCLEEEKKEEMIYWRRRGKLNGRGDQKLKINVWRKFEIQAAFSLVNFARFSHSTLSFSLLFGNGCRPLKIYILHSTIILIFMNIDSREQFTSRYMQEES